MKYFLPSIRKALLHGSFLAFAYYVGAGQALSSRTILGILVFLLPVPLAGYLINDIADWAEDAHQVRKLNVEGSLLWSTVSGVPIRANGRRGAAIVAAVSCLVVALFGAIGTPLQAATWILYLFIGVNYSVGLRMKAAAPLDVLANGVIYAGPIVLGVVDSTSTLLFTPTTAATALLVMALHGLHTVADLDSDAEDPSLRTIAISMGTERTVVVAIGALSLVAHWELFTSRLANSHAWLVWVAMLISVSTVDTRTMEGRRTLGLAMARGLFFIGASFALMRALEVMFGWSVDG